MTSSWLARMRGSMLVRNAGWMFVGQLMRMSMAALYFIIIARALGPENLGSFAGALALVTMLSPFASLGAGGLLVRDVARDRNCFPASWGHALAMTFTSGAILLAVVILLSRVALSSAIPVSLVALLAVSEFLFAQLLEISSRAFQAMDKLQRTAQFHVMLAGFRLAAALPLLAVVHSPGPVHWAIGYLASSACAGVAAAFVVRRELGRPQFRGMRLRRDLRVGFQFAIGLSTASITSDTDKAMLTRLSTLAASGIYTAAYRVIDLAFVPVRSLIMASYASFFRHGTEGIRGSLAFARRLLPISVGYSCVIGVGLLAFAPVVPKVLGPEYSDTVDALRWLAFLPLLRSGHYFAADALTGAGHQGLRSWIHAFIAAFNVLVNLWLIPAHSWRGAAWASLATDGLLVVAMWTAALWIRARKAAGNWHQDAGNVHVTEGVA